MKQVSYQRPSDIRHCCTELGCDGSLVPRIFALLVSTKEVFWMFVQVYFSHWFPVMTILNIFFGMLVVVLQYH
jgi:hypothetical protein